MLTFLLKNNPKIVSIYYSDLLYKKLSFFKNLFFDLTDFAIGEIIYFSFISIVLFNFLKNNISINKIVSSALVIIYFFYISWGLNYFRPPLVGSINNDIMINEEKIENLTKFFSNQCNLLKKDINFRKESETDYLNFYKYLIECTNEKFKYSNINFILSYMGIKGYYNPFTNEANINSRIPKVLIPVTIYHELAHRHGFASERDANFVGFLKAYNHNSSEIRYSASFFAFRYLYSDLYKINPNLAKDVYKSLSDAVRKDISAVTDYWTLYENRFQVIQKSIFDLFLKTQGQKKGINSYNEVVKLLLSTFDGENKFILNDNT